MGGLGFFICPRNTRITEKKNSLLPIEFIAANLGCIPRTKTGIVLFDDNYYDNTFLSSHFSFMFRVFNYRESYGFVSNIWYLEVNSKHKLCKKGNLTTCHGGMNKWWCEHDIDTKIVKRVENTMLLTIVY